MILHGDPLPWVKEGVRLGNFFENKYDSMIKDVKAKRAAFISKNCDLKQEFMFTRLFSEDAARLEILGMCR